MIIICTSLDDHFLLYGLVFLDSLFLHTSSDVRVDVLESGLSEDSRAKLQDMARRHNRSVGFKQVPNTGVALRIDQHASAANYFRLALAHIYRNEAEYVLYIDADTLVTGNLDELLNMRLESEILAAVPNPQGFLHAARLKIPLAYDYFNSGVLVICLKRYDEISTQISSILQMRGKELLLWDQDVLNLAVEGKWRRLSPIWNLTHRIALMAPTPAWAQAWIENARIIHFTGAPKPIEGGLRKHPYYERYRKEALRLSSAYAIPMPPQVDALSRLQRCYQVCAAILEHIGKRVRFLGYMGLHLSAACRQEAFDKMKSSKQANRLSQERKLIECYFPDRSVVAGPFKGLKYREASVCSALLPKFLGTYESEIANELIRMMEENAYPVVHDIGSAEGYYACGLAQRFPNCTVHAYDTDPNARRECLSLAELNNLSNLEMKEYFSLDALRERAGSRCLIISDCEGYERTLFSPYDPNFNLLKECDLIIECHDFLFQGITPALVHALEPSHVIRIVSSLPTHVKASEVLREGGYNYPDLLLMCNERRPGTMNWLVCISRDCRNYT